MLKGLDLVGVFFAANSLQSFPSSLMTKRHTDGMRTWQIPSVGPLTLRLIGLSNGFRIRRVRVRRSKGETPRLHFFCLDGNATYTFIVFPQSKDAY